MSKNIVVIIHHIATIVSVTISSVLLKKQIYQKSYCKLEKLFNSKKIKKYAITLLIVSSTAFKILVPFLVYEKTKK